VLFSFAGQTILDNPLLVAYLALPNLLHYAIMIAWTFPLGYFLCWKYESAIDTTIIGSSSHFEVAIAVAITLYGIGSGAALATVIGPLMEVPLMLSLVNLGLRTRKYFPRKKPPNRVIGVVQVVQYENTARSSLPSSFLRNLIMS